MSDSESFESQTETEQSIVVQPYQFEAVADSDYEEDETDEDDIL